MIRHLKKIASSTLSLLLVANVTPACSGQEDNVPWRASPELVKKWASSRNFSDFNFDESKVPNYSLPNPLLKNDGNLVANKEEWNESRRCELMEVFRGQMYGRRPTVSYSLSFEETAKVQNAFNGAATGRAMRAKIRVGEREFSFPFVVFVPHKVVHPVPAVVHIDWVVSIQKATTELDPRWPAWPVEMLIERGYATAAFSLNDVDPDKKDGYTNGIRGFLANGNQPSEDVWGSLSAWGWGASRVLDYLESLDVVDKTHVAVSGHSRLGTTALWAACEDVRFALAYGNNSGCTGAALTRRRFGEDIGAITRIFPHHYCKGFSSYAGRDSEFPV